MFPFLPLGPLSIPTAPFFAILAVWCGLSVMARAGARQSLDPDRVASAGFLALAAGIIVARLWHVVQFWMIYREEPLLIFSLRPGGLEAGPGLVAALIAGYAYLLYTRLAPAPVAAALSLGLLAADAILQVGFFLTGTVVGLPSQLPWAIPYFGEPLHPVGLYRGLGALAVAVLIFWRADFHRPWRVVLTVCLGAALVRLVADGFLANAATLGPVRLSQAAALAVALAAALLLSRGTRGAEIEERREEP